MEAKELLNEARELQDIDTTLSLEDAVDIVRSVRRINTDEAAKDALISGIEMVAELKNDKVGNIFPQVFAFILLQNRELMLVRAANYSVALEGVEKHHQDAVYIGGITTKQVVSKLPIPKEIA